MKITKIEKFKVVVPMKPGAVNSPEYDVKDPGLANFWRSPKFIIRVHTNDEAVVGIGETKRGCTEAEVDAGISSLLGKDPLRLDLHDLPCPRTVTYYNEFGNTARTSSYCAFETAIFDIVGKHLSVPVHKLLGKKARDEVAIDYWSGRATPEDLARKSRYAKGNGFRGIKIKCEYEDPNVERVRAIAEACGKGFRVTLDPNCRFYYPANAVTLADALGPLRESVAVFEDPVPKNDLSWYVLLRKKLQVPLALHLETANDVLDAVKRECVDFLNLSPVSMLDFVKCAFIAETAGIPVWRGTAVDLGILDMSFIHQCAVAPNCTLPSDIVGSIMREDDLIVDPIRIENGSARVPDAPGLGVELDESAVKRYSVAG